jgi:hypothetical protein
MWFRSALRSRKPRRQASPVQPSRRQHTARPWVEPLEDRTLLSGTVTLAPSVGSPLVGARVAWTATAVDPVQHRAARRRIPRGPRLQPRQYVRVDADTGGQLRHPGHRQGRLPGDRDHFRRGGRRGRLAGVRVAGRCHAHAQPARGLVQRPAVLGRVGVRPVRRGERPPGLPREGSFAHERRPLQALLCGGSLGRWRCSRSSRPRSSGKELIADFLKMPRWEGVF